jgi:hypothetical protein
VLRVVLHHFYIPLIFIEGVEVIAKHLLVLPVTYNDSWVYWVMLVGRVSMVNSVSRISRVSRVGRFSRLVVLVGLE